MTSVVEIERAVAELPPEQLAAFRAWFLTFEAERFDEQLAEDVLSGRLDRFADEALDDFDQGRTRPL